MKSLLAFAVILCSMMMFSCNEPATLPESGYIRSKVNGFETIYAGHVTDYIGNYMHSNELHLSFQKNNNRYLTWSIDIRGVDFKNIALPFTIHGPKDASLNEPVFWCNILDSDPKHSAYGKILAGTTSLDWNTTLTLTSIEGNVVKGTFEGEGNMNGKHGTFSDGEFVAVFE